MNRLGGGRFLIVLPVAGILFSAAGCSSRLPTYPVSGKVVFQDGSPVHMGTVEFRSKSHAVQARGEIANDGSFKLTTFENDDGAVEGLHDCVVVQFVMVEEVVRFRPSTEGVIHPRFGSYSTSGLQFEVSAKAKNDLTVRVEGVSNPSADGKSNAGHSHEHEHEHQHEP